MEKDIEFNTTNESANYSKPRITSGEYEFKIADIKPSEDKTKNYFILEIPGQMHEEKPVTLVWSSPINAEYSPATNVGKLFLSVGIELGAKIMGSNLINLTGRCLVQDYSKQVKGDDGNMKTITYSVIGELIIPQQVITPVETEAQSNETAAPTSGVNDNGEM